MPTEDDVSSSPSFTPPSYDDMTVTNPNIDAKDGEPRSQNSRNEDSSAAGAVPNEQVATENDSFPAVGLAGVGGAIASELRDTRLTADSQNASSTLERPRAKSDADIVKMVAALDVPMDETDDGLATGRWTQDEHQAFLGGLQTFGREWKKVAAMIPTRSSAQVRSHAQKYFAKIQRQQDHLQQHPHQASLLDNEQQPANVVSCVDSSQPGLSASARAEADRILAQPEAVQREVHEMMDRLHDRYRLLQERLQQQQQYSRRRNNTNSDSNASVILPDINVSSRSAAAETLGDQEMIAVDVLRGVLPLPVAPAAPALDPGREAVADDTSVAGRDSAGVDDTSSISTVSSSSSILGKRSRHQ